MQIKDNIKDKSIDELKDLCQTLRDKIIQTLSVNGGHLGSSLGAIELIVAMHYVFDSKSDPFIYDVSHQAYAHKLLTNRWDSFDTLRQFNGISGFIKPDESEDDFFIAGHSSTSISLAVGAAKKFKLKNEDNIPIALIGDGSMSAGMVYEAMNELGDQKYPAIILLNDNEMSIAKPIGAISNYLSQIMASPFYKKFKGGVENILHYLPDSAEYMAKRFEDGFKLITPGLLFEELGIEYIGPINGHNIEQVINTLKKAKNLKKPVIIHAQTIKGKGYTPAEGPHEKWHGVGPFDIKTGTSTKAKSTSKSATQIFSDHLYELASKNENIVGLTAAMPGGTGIDKLMQEYPNRFWDVGIAEQHSVTSAASMAKLGLRPFIAIYSTFLQRAYDQIIHDVSIMNLPVIFAIDRAGIVGADGETHQGAFDVSYLRTIPNMTLLAPRDEQSLKNIMDYTLTHTSSPIAFRYPRGGFERLEFSHTQVELGKSELLKESNLDTLFISYGTSINKALAVSKSLELNVALLDLVFVKPLDINMLIKLSKKHTKWYIFSDSSKMGGVASAIMEALSEHNITDIQIKSFEFPDTFIPHGDNANIEKLLKIDTQSITKQIKEELCL
ncbi:MAG: 1-deoxy-D-xylulose 5-phosphate synthase (EC [uncultured Campylobacterales bacterium]|uniref:1-deoxy-D-xylulose-5-phosphate synthase n=1 Tax=uncultured Campylobacterales bacterium TaxID=352960 RepID=A0A6S6SI72_9BACT|nr:MAG: 1-deoxy-D-xylulose 5-phosphate synthase (EC [uncultured Campylobacterales bacterium]